MVEKHETKRDGWMAVVMFGSPLAIWILALIIPHWSIFLIAFLMSALMGWCWFDTSYTTDEQFLRYRSGPFRGKIPIDKITRLTPNTRSWSETRPGLSFTYLRIRYNQYDELFVSPLEEDRFIAALKERNPTITVGN